jgi:hypothetical protein
MSQGGASPIGISSIIMQLTSFVGWKFTCSGEGGQVNACQIDNLN